MYNNHAYALRTCEYSEASQEYYVELVNPWDDANSLKLSLTSLLNDSKCYFNIYGYTTEQFNNFITNPFNENGS